MSLLPKNRFTLFLLYFLLINILFYLPGSALPKVTWLNKIWFDKWVHVGLFAVLTFLGLWAFSFRKNIQIVILLLLLILYGFMVEVVQDQLIRNRSFDLGDWLADIIGVIVGGVSWRYKKNRPL